MSPINIIVQDRDTKTANSLRALLTAAGYAVITIRSRKSLPYFIEKFKPHLLIIESNIAENDAKEILAEMRKNLKIKILATMCDDQKTYIVDHIGFDGCLSKPFKIEELLEEINKQLSA